MKKLVLVALAAVFTLTACDKDKDDIGRSLAGTVWKYEGSTYYSVVTFTGNKLIRYENHSFAVVWERVK